MWGIIARNRGMWGCSSWCKRDGKVELYDTEEEAQKVADKYSDGNRINCFTSYFASKYEED